MNILNQVGFRDLHLHLDVAYETKTPVIIQGAPGTGKTETSHEWGGRKVAATGNTVWGMHGPSKTEEYWSGLTMPVYEGKAMVGKGMCRHMLPEHFLQVKSGDIIIIDEFDKMPHHKQNVVLELINNKTMDDYKLGGDGRVLFVILANASTHKNGSYDVSGLASNRSFNVQFMGEPREYLDHFMVKGMHGYLYHTLSENPSFICPQYVPTQARNATPRSHMRASTAMHVLDRAQRLTERSMMQTLAGFLPDNLVTAVMAHHQYAGSIVAPEEVLADPEGVKIARDDRGLQFLQLSMVCAHVAGLQSKQTQAKEALWKFSKRLPLEFRGSIMPLMMANPFAVKLLDDGEYLRFVNERKEILASL